MKATEQYFPVVLFITLYKVVLTFESVDEILWCYHSNESYWAVLSFGTVYYAVRSGSKLWVWGLNPLVWHFKWKLFGIPFPLMILLVFHRFLKMKFKKLCSILTFVTFGKRVKIFFIRELIDWLVSKMVYFSFLVLAGRVYGNWSHGFNFIKTWAHCSVLFCGAYSQHLSSVSGVHGRGKKNLTWSKYVGFNFIYKSSEKISGIWSKRKLWLNLKVCKKNCN